MLKGLLGKQDPSPPHLDDTRAALLSLFLKPRPLDEPNWQDVWADALGCSYQSAIKELVRLDLLTRMSGTVKEKIDTLTVPRLKELLKQQGLKVSGNKAELVERLLTERPQEAQKVATQIKWADRYICTETGAVIGTGYKERTRERKQSAEIVVREALQRGNLAAAGRAVEAFRASLPAPMAGAGLVHVSTDEAEAILRIVDIPDLTSEEVAAAKLRAAEDAIWGRQISAPRQLEKVMYTQMFRASNQRTLRSLREARIPKVDILATRDSCESCQRLANAGPYRLDKVPAIPNPECTHSIGWCRCCYAAHIE